MKSVIQAWVHALTFMQQSVLLSAIRGCDGLPKRHKAKELIKWYRRCILLSAFDGKVLSTPYEPGGGSFTGPIVTIPRGIPDKIGHDIACKALQKVADDFIDSRDEIPTHYQVHVLHAVEIIGYKHPDLGIREFWFDMYERLAKAYHLWPETEVQMDKRLGDTFSGWAERNDSSTSCSD